MVHGGMTLVKYLLFLFNFIFWLSGIAIIVAGAVIQIKYTHYMNFLGNTFLAAPIVLIVVGCVVAILGFFGCCGAIRENYCMTMTFAVLLGLIFFAELGVGIASYALKDDVEDIIMEHTKRGMDNYNGTESGLVTEAWDKMQRGLKCCGAENYTDWENITIVAGSKGDVPDSCCVPPKSQPKEFTEGCGRGQALKSRAEVEKELAIFDKGCVSELKFYAVEQVALVGGIGVGVAFIQILGIALSCIYATGLRRGYETV